MQSNVLFFKAMFFKIMFFKALFFNIARRQLWNRFFAALLTLFCLTAVAPVYAFHFPWDQGHDTTDLEDPEDPGPCEDGECENDPCNSGSQGSPVYLATGHFIWSETDISLKGRPNLSVDRTFNSHDPRVGLLGAGWSMGCDKELIYTVRYQIENNNRTQINEYVRRLANGKRYVYSQQSDGTFVGSGLFDVVIRQPDNTARLQWRNGNYNVFAETGKLLSEVDRKGNAIHYTYDVQGRLIQKADTNGRSLNYEYNTNGLVSIIRDHTDREWQYGYDENANLISVTDPLGGIRRYEYDQYQPPGDGHIYSHLTRVTDASGVAETEVTYSGTKVSSYRELENTFTYQYNTANRQVTKTDSQNSRWVFTYNETGQFIRIDAPLNRITLYERDTDSLITKITDPSGTAYSYTYDQYSNRVSQTDTRGTIATTYDNQKPWPLTITSRSGRVTTLAYDANGNPLNVTDSAGQTTGLVWSTQGDLLQTTNALGHQATISYNSQGLPLTSSDALGRTTQYQYDALNNLIQVTNPAGEVAQYQYDALDRVIAYTDGNGDVTTYIYDSANRTLQVSAPNGHTVQYGYDTFGRLTQNIFYDGTTHSYQYRNDNMLAQMIRPDNIIITFNYDTAKRLTQRTMGSEDTYNYRYNLRDELISVQNTTGTVSLTYDEFGRTLSETANNETSLYQYSNENEITQITSLGSNQSHQFDMRGLLSQIDINGSTYSYIYDALQRVTALNRSTATNSLFQYDVANQLTQINHGNGQRNYLYQYDSASRVSQWQGIANEIRDYNYDQANRLTQVQSVTAPETFNYDALGNRQNNNAQFDIANRITENNHFAYVYDINGNRTQKTNKTTGEVERYTYNSLNQLIGYQVYPDNAPTTAAITHYSYHYGPLERRWRKTNHIANTTTEFYWSGSRLIGENKSGVVRRYILEAITPVGFIENGDVYHYFRDHLGTAHEITDNNGGLVWQGNYNSFGEVSEVVNVIDNNMRFAGQYWDEEAGLHYNYYRNYDPSLGRYLQSDPIGLAGGINTYGYVNGNPLKYIDPYGLTEKCITILKLPFYDVQACKEDGKHDDTCDADQEAKDAKRMSKKELDKAAKNNGYKDAHDMKRDYNMDSKSDIFVDRHGNLYEGPRQGAGTPQPLGINKHGI